MKLLSLAHQRPRGQAPHLPQLTSHTYTHTHAHTHTHVHILSLSHSLSLTSTKTLSDVDNTLPVMSDERGGAEQTCHDTLCCAVLRCAARVCVRVCVCVCVCFFLHVCVSSCMCLC